MRQDGQAKVTGEARYTADLRVPGMAYGRFLLAGVVHARIRAIDTAAARALDGVLAVITQADVPDVRHGRYLRDRTLFADGVVRFEGEVVAAVAAVSEEVAAQALELIEVDYEPLEPVLDPEAALAPEAPLVHPGWAEYQGKGVREGNDCSRTSIVKGDAAAAMAEADVVLKQRFRTDMSHPVPIEPHAVLAEWTGGRVTIWTTSQVPFHARTGVAETLELPENHVRVIVPALGGGFGGKCDFHFEAHVAALARAARRPVRVVLSRREEFLAPDKTRHPMTIELETGARHDGTLVARRARLLLDGGAYAADSPILTQVATMNLVGPYRVPHVDVEARAAYTNRTPAGSTRAPTGPQVCWAVEQHVEALAAKLGLDPYELRMHNLVEDGDEGPTRQRLEAVGMKRALARARELIEADGPLGPGEGIGYGCGWWTSMASATGAYVKLNDDGSATLVTGAQENGSGAVMGLPIMAAQVLGMEPDDFSIVYQDTETGPWDGGSEGSQTTFNGGRAVVAAAEEIREQLLDLAADEMEIAPQDLELTEGTLRARGTQKSLSIATLVQRAHARGRLVLGQGSGEAPAQPEHDLGDSVGRWGVGAFTAPTFFAHAARVRVDRETGVVRVLAVAAAHDFGHVINPVGATGQVHGGVMHAIGMALTERTQMRDGRQLNPYLLDYKLQTAADAPRIDVAFIDAPTEHGGPFGIKGAGEPPVVPTCAAVANALAAAAGVRVHELPMTPERVWAALQPA